MPGDLINQIGFKLSQKATPPVLGFENYVQNYIPNQEQIAQFLLNSNCLMSPTDSSNSDQSVSTMSSSESTIGDENSNKRNASPDDGEIVAKKPKMEQNDSDTDGSDEHCDKDAVGSPSLNSALIMKPLHLIAPEDVFMSVPGRLSLLTSTTRYKVTIGEIQRRLGHPENLNASILGAILRRAKSKNGGKELRAIIDSYGMNLPAGKRKTSQLTLFTSLIEGEAEQLARDFETVCVNDFPSKEFAQHAVMIHQKQDAENLQKRREELQTALKVMNELISLMTDPTPFTKLVLNQSLQHFQLITHNFGNPALISAFSTFNRYVNLQLEYLSTSVADKKPTMQMQSAQQIMNNSVPLNLQHPNLQNLLRLVQLTNRQQ